MAETLTETEAEEIIRNFGEGKSNLHSFFTNVIKSSDTTKTGNLSTDELGMPQLPVRTYKELGMFCHEVADMDIFSTYFNKMSEIITSSSLSKDALLMKLAVTIKKELGLRYELIFKAPKNNLVLITLKINAVIHM
jgi:hypothetical protein